MYIWGCGKKGFFGVFRLFVFSLGLSSFTVVFIIPRILALWWLGLSLNRFTKDMFYEVLRLNRHFYVFNGLNPP